ncbi:MAG TPA: hypothetical protein PKK31_08255 [Elusimicrobiales bacterium]|nr:hypothetical protein [Elusimicrobiales bacterium]
MAVGFQQPRKIGNPGENIPNHDNIIAKILKIGNYVAENQLKSAKAGGLINPHRQPDYYRIGCSDEAESVHQRILLYTRPKEASCLGGIFPVLHRMDLRRRLRAGAAPG